jgi:hypothetical protein
MYSKEVSIRKSGSWSEWISYADNPIAIGFDLICSLIVRIDSLVSSVSAFNSGTIKSLAHGPG